MVLFNSEKSNGSSVHTLEDGKSENEHVWDHPWTTNEIRKNSTNWTLAGDVGLLNHLKEFSHKLISRTHEMEKVVDSLLHKSKVACAKVNNVVNDFQMLSNLQFVENRVYDEEVKVSEPVRNADTQEKTKEQREAEMVPKIIQALQLGVSVLDKAFEKIIVDETSESEDEEDLSCGRTVLEPKDFYEHRPLPCIIGSVEFENDDYAGLHYMNDEDISMDLSTQDVSVSSESEVESDEESEEEVKPPPPPRRPTILNDRKDTKSSEDTLPAKDLEDSDSSLFDDAEDEDADFLSPTPVVAVEQPKAPKTDSLIDELKKRTKGAGDQPDAPHIEKPVSFKKPEEVNENKNLFSSGDPFLEDEDDDETPFRKKTGLFATNGPFNISQERKKDSLFDDDSDDEDLPPAIKVPPKSSKQPEAKKVTPVVTKVSPPAAAKGRSSSDFLFDDDDDDSDHDLFSNLSKTTKPSISKVTATTAKDVNKVESFAPPKDQTKEKKIFEVQADNKSNSLFGESDSDEESLFSTPSKPKQSDFHLKLNLENDDEDEDDDLFSSKPIKVLPVKTESKITKAHKETTKSSLFENSDNFDLFSSTSEDKIESTIISNKMLEEPKKVSSLFEDSMDESNLFSQPIKVEAKPLRKDVEKPKAKVIEKKLEISAKSPIFPKVLPDIPVKAVINVPETKTLPKVATEDVRDNLFSQEDSESTGFEDSLDFNQPQSETGRLSALNKDRVKGQAKRRKPTRKGRQSRLEVATEEPPQDSSRLSEDSSKPSIEKPQPTDVPKVQPTSYKSTEQSKRNLMSQLMSEAATSKIGRKKSILDIEADDDDLFADTATSNRPIGSGFSFSSEPEKPAESNIWEPNATSQPNLLLSDSTSDDDLFSTPDFPDFGKSTTGKTTATFDDDDDDDDIFKQPNKHNSSLKNPHHSIDDDDIFAGVDEEKYEMFPTPAFDADQDDDDIFSNIVKPVASAKAPAVSKEDDKTEALFTDPLGGLALND